MIFVDQSAADDTERALSALGDDRIVYVKSKVTGKGAALNEALALASTDFVACTDDDCEVPFGWAHDVIAPLRENPGVGLVFSNVVAPDHDTTAGYVPAFHRTESSEIRRISTVAKGWGLGAGMAMRRQAIVNMGGADEALGPGAQFPSADDLDLELRFLLAGWSVYEHAGVEVIHHGFRTWAEGRAHAVRDWRGIGGSIAKGVRGRRPSVVVIGFFCLFKLAVLPALADVARLRRPRLRRITAFCSAFVSGLRLPVDGNTMKYRDTRHDA